MSRRRFKRSSKPADVSGERNDTRSGERLQKVLAAAGVGSRRDCEELIVAGRVEVDRRTVTELGTRVDATQQDIRVDGVALPKPKRVYFALNKPMGVLCTNDDPAGRIRAIDLVRSDERLFTVGRLDRSSEGLILVTNDGELANQLTHPRYGVEKRYIARVAGCPTTEVFEKLRRGVHLAEGFAKVSDIRARKSTSKFSDLEIVLQEGRNREVRRILARVGHKVMRLKRIAIGPLRLAELPEGETRALSRAEVAALRDAALSSKDKSKAVRKSRSPRPGAAVGRQAARPRSGTFTHPTGPPTREPREFQRPAAPSRPPVPEVDELEVTETPVSSQRGAVIGADEGWNATPTTKPNRNIPRTIMKERVVRGGKRLKQLREKNKRRRP